MSTTLPPVPPPPAYPPAVGLDTATSPVSGTTWWKIVPPSGAEDASPGFMTAPAGETPVATETSGTGPGSWWQRLTKEPVAETEQPTEAEPGPQNAEQLLLAVSQNLSTLLSETPEQRTERMRAEREAAYEAAGETPEQRTARHRQERHDRERSASAAWRASHGERARRFRRWCTLTAVSASAGYGMGLVQLLTHIPFVVDVALLGAAWLADVRLRGWGNVRVAEIRGFGGVSLVIVTRIPVASCLVTVLGLAPVLALTTLH